MRDLGRAGIAPVRPAVALLIAIALAAAPVAARAADAGSEKAPPRFKVRSVTGEPLELQRLLERGPVLLDFWATWCLPCIAALPELEGVRARLGPRGLTVIGISVDGPRNFPKVRPFATRLGLTFPIVLDEDGALQQRFQVKAVPTSVLIATDGRLVRVTPGWRPGETADLERAIEALLPDSTNTPAP